MIQKTGFFYLFLLGLVLFLAHPAMSVLIDLGDGTGNTTAPPDDPGFNNVGNRNGASAVYLGNRIAVSAAHVGYGNVVFGVTNYPQIGKPVQLMNGPDRADLLLFQLESDPGLPSATVSALQLSMNDPVTMIGRGETRFADQAFFDASFNELFPPPDPPVGTVFQGYWRQTGNRAIRWGTNNINATNLSIPQGGAPPFFPTDTVAYSVQFNDTLGLTSECQGVAGDSGGAVFSKATGSWELAGIMITRDSFPSQPATALVYGNQSAMADLSIYYSQINSILTDTTDTDADNVMDNFDVCPSVSDPGQEDTDGNYLGDACNSGEDIDGDDWADSLDNCPNVANPGQENTKPDPVATPWGDACELPGDVNRDGVTDALDVTLAIGNWEMTPAVFTDGDSNEDGVVDAVDVTGIIMDWGNCQPAICP